ncbi:MAG: hypothetical protein HYR85_24160 [Planctomycetes bacterium]|nr:hypothetical protein [Planctomycetota bacterium]MBI3843511.1 hypothetical protein [Planctomycetota bacterium]
MSSPTSQLTHIIFPALARSRKALDLARAVEPRPSPPAPTDDVEHESTSFFAWLFGRVGMDSRGYRVETLQRRLPACLRVLHASSLSHARRILEETPSLVSVAMSATLVGVTSFFRDAAVFDLLRQEVLPSIVSSRAGMYVWSIGCSDGAELYSVALLLAEIDALVGGLLLGTDCREDALTRARRGCFDADAVTRVPPELLRRYFVETEAGGDWQVCPQIRRSVYWRAADIMRAQEPGAWDLVFFRNAAMYFRPEVAESLWELLEKSLRYGGVLVVGKAERPTSAKQLTAIGPGVYRRIRT